MDKNELKKLVKEELDKMLEAPKTKAASDVAALQKAEKTSAIASKQAKINTPPEVIRAIISTIKKYMGQIEKAQRPAVKSKIVAALKNIDKDIK